MKRANEDMRVVARVDGGTRGMIELTIVVKPSASIEYWIGIPDVLDGATQISDAAYLAIVETLKLGTQRSATAGGES